MKKYIILLTALLAPGILGAWEFPLNPDRFPSIGLRADIQTLDGFRAETVVNAAGQELPYRNTDEVQRDWRQSVDVRLPVTNSLTLNFGYDNVETEYYFTRRSQSGGDMYKEHRALDGYSYNVGFRLYLNK